MLNPFSVNLHKSEIICFLDSIGQKMSVQSTDSCNVTSGTQFVRKIFTSLPSYFIKHIWKKHRRWSLLFCRKKWQIGFSTQLQLLHYTNWKHWKAAAEFGRNLLHLPPRGLSIYTFQVSDQWKKVFPSIQMLAKLQKVVYFHKRTKGVDRMSNNPKKRFLRKKYRKHLVSSFRETQSQQKNRPVPAERI